jgi:DNA-binding MarR family transcriptional regulator
MVDLRTILQDHRSKTQSASSEDTANLENVKPESVATTSEIPDLLFDTVLVSLKLSRIEILVLMYLYRRVWCRPNLYQKHGISPLLSHTEMATSLNLPIEDVFSGLRKLESYGFITTIRSGQYFVRKYFLRSYDEEFGQTYDDFEL